MSRMAAAIDFGTSKITIVAGRLDERGMLIVTGAGQQIYSGFREDEWLDMVGLEEAILSARKAAEKQAGHRIKDLFVAVPGDYIEVAFNRAEVETKDKNGCVERDDIERLIEESGDFNVPDRYAPLHRTPIAYLMESQTRYKPPIGERSRYLCGYVSHVLALESFIEGVGDILNSLGIGIMGMVAGPVGTGYLVRMDESKRTAVVVDAGHYSTDILVAEGDGLVFHRNIPLGGGTITKDLSVQFHISLEEAERLKRQLILGIHQGEVIADRRGLPGDLLDAQELVESRVWDLSGKIATMLDGIGINFDGQTGVYLTGGGLGLLRGAKDILSSTLGKIVKTYSNQSPMLGGPTYTAAAGSLYYALNVLQASAPRGILGWIRDLF